jgi:hypothetical protein
METVGSSRHDAATASAKRAPLFQDPVLRGLLWQERLAHGPMVLHFLVAWLVLGWVLLIFFHPGWILAFGVLYAVLAAPAFGGGEAFEGSEEFAFALPPTRGDRFFVKLAAGGIPLLGFLLVGLLAIALDLPQRLWGLVVESGFTEPFPAAEPAFLYPLAFAAPVAAYAFTFAIASLAGTRGTVMVSWLGGGLGAAAVMGAGFLAEGLLWEGRLNGYVSCPLLLASAPLALLAAYTRYLVKEGVSRPASGGWGLGVIVMILIIVLLLGLFWLMAAA